jgi:ABC-type cobalamin/Fe3+-siderophores transport system ATPase subunit
MEPRIDLGGSVVGEQMGSVLRLDGVWKAFDRGRDRVAVLEDVSLSVAGGEVVAVVGGSGQGKSTLIRVASGTLPPDCGTVLVNGAELARLRDRELAAVLACDVGVAMGAGPGVRLSVREYVEMAAAAPKDGRRRRWRKRERRLMVTGVLRELGVAECAELRWEELSDWQRVVVELAQAVVVRPRLLLIDDLADGFGLRQKQEVMDLLQGFARELGCGVLMVVSDHAAALRSVRIWQLRRHTLRLMANHTDDGNIEADVIPLHDRRKDTG